MLLLFLQVYENLLLSPGKNTQSFLERASNKKKYNQKVKSSIAYKKRRYELKSSTAKQVNIIICFQFTCISKAQLFIRDRMYFFLDMNMYIHISMY